MENDYLQKATNPHQYDAEVLDWEKEGLQHSPTRNFFQEYLRQYLDVKGKSVLDVGSGMGQLFSLLKELGATKIEGIEPSAKNVETSLNLVPDMPVFQGSLSEAPLKSQYDVISAVMVFEHIDDLNDAFHKINEMLVPNGSFALIVADKKYHQNQRFNYTVESQDLNDGNVVVKTIRPNGIGTLYDILRPIENYTKYAKANGLVLEKAIELKPTEIFMKAEPKYREFADVPICHLLIFKKDV